MQQYTIEEKNLERQYLLAKNLEPLTAKALVQIQFTATPLKILDVACGMGETTRLLAKHFPGADITGADIDEGLLQNAQKQAHNNASLHFIAADAMHLPFADNTFDFVFNRYLLMHVPQPVAVIQEMARVCKPGGIVFTQEPDLTNSTCYPHSWAYDKIVETFLALFIDGVIGRKLPAYCKQAGLVNLHTDAGAAFEVQTNSLRRMYTLTAEALEGAVLAKGLMNKEGHTAWVAELQRVENDANTVHLMHPVVAAWGVKSSH